MLGGPDKGYRTLRSARAREHDAQLQVMPASVVTVDKGTCAAIEVSERLATGEGGYVRMGLKPALLRPNRESTAA